jgi:phosphatidylglycerol lysyltransferase
MKPLHISDREQARSIVLQHGWNSMAYQILNPGISLWLSKHGNGVIGYVETATHVVVAGSPISNEHALTEITSEFYQFVSEKNKKVCFFGAQQKISQILSNYTPLSSIVLGAQPTWIPEEWIKTFNTKQSLRAQIQRVQNKHVSARIIQVELVEIKDDLKRCLHEWIQSRHLPPMHFLVEPNTLDVLEDRILCIAEKENRIVGFCIASPIPMRKGWLIEQIIRGKDAPNGTSELLLHTLITEVKNRKSEFITLGLSPLSMHSPLQYNHPVWLRLCLRCIRSWGKIFYNFDGLDQFKTKYHPAEWEPVFAITNESKPTLSTLYAIATAFTVISPIRFVVKGILKYTEHLL